jgi:hypothetical protein
LTNSHPPDDLAGARRLPVGALQRTPRAFRIALLEEALTGPDVIADRGRRLVHRMRQRRDHLAEFAEAQIFVIATVWSLSWPAPLQYCSSLATIGAAALPAVRSDARHWRSPALGNRIGGGEQETAVPEHVEPCRGLRPCAEKAARREEARKAQCMQCASRAAAALPVR